MTFAPRERSSYTPREVRRGVYSASVTFSVGLVIVMAGFECSSLYPRAAPFACPLFEHALAGPRSEAGEAEAMATLFWIAAIFSTTLVSYGFAHFSHPADKAGVLAGAAPYAVLVLVWLQGVLSDGTGASHAWIFGYGLVVVVHIIASRMGSRAAQDGPASGL